VVDYWNVSRNHFPQADLQVPLPGDRISSLRKDEHANSQQTQPWASSHYFVAAHALSGM